VQNGAAISVYWMYMSGDGTVVTQKRHESVFLRPYGTIRVLVVLIQYPETVPDSAPTLWEAAQDEINRAHAEFARSRGYAAPIVVFENTNVLVQPADIGKSSRSGWGPPRSSS
jgi:hypothetical protein